MVTQAQLAKIFPFAGVRISMFLAPLNAAMAEFEINTPERIQMFLAQIGHESGELRYVRELASGEKYEWREDLGNTVAGYGKKYKGRGLIQITGYFNYLDIQEDFGIPCVDHPEILETPINAVRVSTRFWKKHGCNELADAGDFLEVTKRINGGTRGLALRVAYFEKAKEEIQ